MSMKQSLDKFKERIINKSDSISRTNNQKSSPREIGSNIKNGWKDSGVYQLMKYSRGISYYTKDYYPNSSEIQDDQTVGP